MLTDVIAYLAIDHISRITSPDVSLNEAELRAQLFEAKLSAASRPHEDAPQMSDAEIGILQSYLDLDLNDLDSLSPETHAWFLERLAATASFAFTDYVQRITDLYFLSRHGVLRYLTTLVLLALDQRMLDSSNHGESFAHGIWVNILRDRGLSPDQKAELLQELADILVDIFTDQALNALRMMVQAEREIGSDDWETPPTASRIRARASQFGGATGSRLLSVLG